MADISMCADLDCPSRGQCHRWCAWPSGFRQAYGDFQRPWGRDLCDNFWPRREGDRTPDQADADLVCADKS